MICSKDVRKTINRVTQTLPVTLSDADYFSLEIALHAHNNPIAVADLLLRNTATVGFTKALPKTVAQICNGYIKTDRRCDFEVDWQLIMGHYYYLAKKYLDSDFPITDIQALVELSTYRFTALDKAIASIKVKNLWYLLKVMQNTEKQNADDIKTYKEANITPQDRGAAKFDTGKMRDYVGN